MANATSIAWPNMFNISQNRVAVYEDNKAIVSRGRLLMLTESTEVYNEPDQGVGLKRYMYRYHHDNVKAEICDRAKVQFGLHDPKVDAPNIQWADGLKFTGSEDNIETVNSGASHLKMTMALPTTYGEVINMNLNDLM
ncbi:MAG: hypothetical protein NC548_60000 [Lachnospiraceae bacterium]|nr:hypothetical protein [Lachnospiraceae bacterium]